MIDWERIRQERTWQRAVIELLINVPELFLVLYGLKMLATLHGHMLRAAEGQVYHRLSFVPVDGTLAVTVGLLYLAFGVFVYMADGRPPAESRGWFWRLGRAALCWGSFAVALLCFLQADKMATGRGLDLAGLPDHLLLKIVGFFAGVIGSLFFLRAMYQREQVKRELESRDCKPLHILWRPNAYWLWRYRFTWWFPTGFRVIYSDPGGSIHKGYCFVYRSFQDDPRLGNRRVRWLTDEVTARGPAPEVWADSEILRAKLGAGEVSAEANNQSDESPP